MIPPCLHQKNGDTHTHTWSAVRGGLITYSWHFFRPLRFSSYQWAKLWRSHFSETHREKINEGEGWEVGQTISCFVITLSLVYTKAPYRGEYECREAVKASTLCAVCICTLTALKVHHCSVMHAGTDCSYRYISSWALFHARLGSISGIIQTGFTARENILWCVSTARRPYEWAVSHVLLHGRKWVSQPRRVRKSQLLSPLSHHMSFLSAARGHLSRLPFVCSLVQWKRSWLVLRRGTRCGTNVLWEELA